MRVLALLLAAGPAAAECAPDRVTIEGGFGRAGFQVQVADEPAEWRQGLMGVPSMGTLQGMLFVYDEPGPRSFWMANTLIPLDILFADASGTITRVHENAVPLDETSIPGGEEVQFVLEVNGGLAARLGIAAGDRMAHPAIDAAGQAALPCG